jgi:hypothetical protein
VSFGEGRSAPVCGLAQLRISDMPPKTLPLHAQPAPVRDTLGMNPDYLLPHQQEQFRRHLATISDLQDRKAKESNNNPQTDAAIVEARAQLSQLAQAAQQHEQAYPTREAFQNYLAQYNQNLQQRRAELANTPQPLPDKLRTIQIKSQQLTARLRELEGIITRPEGSDEDKKKARADFGLISQQLETLKAVYRENQSQWQQAANNSQESTQTVSAQAPTPLASQPQPLTPTVRNVPPAPHIQQQQQQGTSQPTLPAPVSMGQIPRPVVTNVNPPPPRPTLSGGYPVGTPLLGTAPSVGASTAFTLAKDGDTRLLSKRKLQDLVKSIDPDERLEPDVEEVYSLSQPFSSSYANNSC